jgi:hypothetical protein
MGKGIKRIYFYTKCDAGESCIEISIEKTLDSVFKKLSTFNLRMVSFVKRPTTQYVPTYKPPRTDCYDALRSFDCSAHCQDVVLGGIGRCADGNARRKRAKE